MCGTRSLPSPAAATVGFDRWREPPPDPQIEELLPWHQWWNDFESSPTSHAAFDIFFTHGIDILERVAPLAATLHGAAGDPESAQVARISEERRVDSYREAVRVIAGKRGGLRPQLTPREASDILIVLFSAELYQPLRAGRGWSAERTPHSYAGCSRRSSSPSYPAGLATINAKAGGMGERLLSVERFGLVGAMT